LADVVRNRVYITDADELMAVAKVLGERFGPNPPANTTLVCVLPVPGARVEIEVTARLPEAARDR
jgi:enamine deaminase RidA (YjgF/YER057c/UK114 family)